MRLQIKEQFSNMQDFVILRCVRVSQFILQNWISKNNKREKRQTNRMARPRSHTHTFTHANNDLVRIGKLSAERRYCARTQTHTHTHTRAQDEPLPPTRRTANTAEKKIPNTRVGAPHDKCDSASWKIRRDRLVDHKSKPRFGVNNFQFYFMCGSVKWNCSTGEKKKSFSWLRFGAYAVQTPRLSYSYIIYFFVAIAIRGPWKIGKTTNYLRRFHFLRHFRWINWCETNKKVKICDSSTLWYIRNTVDKSIGWYNSDSILCEQLIDSFLVQ